MSLFQELKRRKVIRVAIAYVISAWLLLQLTEVLSELLTLPDNIGPVVVWIVIIGFPIVIVLAWVYELTSDGLKRDSDVKPGERSSGKLINAVVVGLLVAALGYFIWESRFASEAGQDSASNTTIRAQANSDARVDDQIGRSIAVLPFENFSGNPEDEYFADGLTDTLLHKLAQIDELKVIARNSTFQFKGTNKDVREIGETLDVETVLEGSVQRAGNQVRIIAQLIRTSDGAHVWSESFDDSMDNIFDLQDRIATGIISAFELTLSASEQQRLLQNGTDNAEAYDLVIQALNTPWDLDEKNRAEPEDDEELQLLLQAVALDPDYALAWAYLSRAWNGLAFATDSSERYDQYVAKSKAAAEHALSLNGSLAMPHAALGWVAHRENEVLSATAHFRRALEIEPNNLDAMSGLALQLMRSDPETALTLLERLHQLDPTNAVVYRQKHFAYMLMGQPEPAMAQLEAAIELSPGEGMFYNDLTDLHALYGRPDEGARVSSRLLEQSPDSAEGQLAMAEAWSAAGEFERTAQWLELILESQPDSDRAKRERLMMLLRAGRYEELINALEDVRYREAMNWFEPAVHGPACLGLQRPECAIQQARSGEQALEEYLERGNNIGDAFVYPGLIQLLAAEMKDPDFADPERAEQLLTLLDESRIDSPSPFTRAGLLARLNRLEEASEHLESTVSDPDGAVFNFDSLGFNVADSPLLNPFRDSAAYDDWQKRHQTYRDAMIDRMRTMEQRGEIMSVRQIRRVLAR